ncbi:MAG TPA: SusD/RagB family nutrient-binding outer membrane lipoprotein, partial [Gemmatimonadaceae bacterium]|nr:SusD/RagB family nutrient-binding outer membrane lipoprotein [Gemmatimonadaceae bacterium]
QIGTAADFWGDIPYSEANDPAIATPRLDPQLEVYAAIQGVLDAAIGNLAAGVGAGPGSKDLVYQGNAARWTQLAYTLKARYYMHVAEVDASAYALAKAAAALGISSHANDYTTVHAGTAGEENLWHQFIVRERTEYISPGAYLIELMKSRSEPRLPEYFTEGATNEYLGAEPGEGYTSSLSNLSDERLDPSFSQPIVSYDENALIWAEAAYRTADEITALSKLNEVRTHHGLPAIVAAGPTLFSEIMIEKYISLFQSLEVWNDWKRTCIPDMTPALGAAIIPARFFYPTDERQTNTNVPAVEAQPLRNPNDPANAGCNSQN